MTSSTLVDSATRTILDDLRSAVRRTPDRAAVIGWRTKDGRREPISYASLSRTVERLAAGLVRLGVKRGEVVTIQLPNCWQLIALYLACARAGVVAGPVAPVMRQREVEFMTRLTESPVYIGPTVWRGFSYADIAKDVPTLRHRFLLDLSGGGQELRPLEADLPAAELDARQATAGDLAQVMFTSGTTGEPKGVMHSHATLYANNVTQAEVLGLTGDEITAMGSPSTLQGGYTWNFIMPLQLGGTSVQVDAWAPDVMLRILETEGVSFFMGAPTFLMDLVRAQRQTPRDLTALRTFAVGSAPIPPVLVEDALAVLGCRVYALWGMTENGCVTITRPQDPPLRAAASDGTPLPGMQVRIVDPETGAAVAAGAAGALQVRGIGQCLGYFKRPELYRACLSEDGWFDTGDLARDDGYGGIRIAGRAKDVISRGAEKVPAVEVEAALLRHKAIRDVAVVGYPDPRLGERACAILVADGSPPTLDDVREHLDGLGMAKPYWPERLKVVDELPKTPSGKVQKFRLRQQLEND
jgi:cyclohexanecarboxylate-CoA ligase